MSARKECDWELIGERIMLAIVVASIYGGAFVLWVASKS